jgi:hypothetical protein
LWVFTGASGRVPVEWISDTPSLHPRYAPVNNLSVIYT